jgi:hypothetical protein
VTVHRQPKEFTKQVLEIINELARRKNTGQAPVLTSVILATQEAEIRRTAVQSQPKWIVPKTLS